MKFLEGARVEKIYQDTVTKKDRNLRIKVYVRKIGSFEIFASSGRFHITKQIREGREKPTEFSMFLRKRLKNKRIKEIRQYDFERIAEIIFDDYILIIELFHNGNFIFVDKSYKIIKAFEYQKWSDRIIAPNITYEHPKTNMFEDDYNKFKRIIYASPRDVLSFLVRLGFGSLYAEELLNKSAIDKEIMCQALEEEKVKILFDEIKRLMTKNAEPKIVIENNKIIDAIPFMLCVYEGKQIQEVASFNQAIDSYYGLEKTDNREEERDKKREIIIKQHKEAIKKLEKKQKEKKAKADLIYKNYGLVSDILNLINKARQKYSWNEIKQIIEKEDSIEANSIIEIREHDGIIVVDLNGKNVELDITKSVEENAAMLYEKSKHARKKQKKTEKSLASPEKILSKLQNDFIPKIKERKKQKRWYERFRYFWTSDGFLVVAGKDADTNEQLIKKYVEPTDIVLHAEIQGAPFVVIKSRIDARIKEIKEITPVAIREASEFGASYSKAWQMGLGNVDMYWIRPNQVKKVPGLPKGSFQIQGERNYLKKTPLKIAIGFNIKNKKLEYGPSQAIRSRCKYMTTIKPGDTSATELARRIKEDFISKAVTEEEANLLKSINLNDIEKLIPSRRGSFILGQ